MCALGCVLALGCGGAQPVGERAAGEASEVPSIYDFPELAELDARLGAGSAPALLPEPAAESEGWAFEGPIPTTAEPEPHESDTPAGRMILAAAAARPEVDATAAAHCLAREAAAHWLRTGRHLAQGHRRFLASRCGVVGQSVGLLALPLDAGRTLESVAGQVLAHVDRHLDGPGLKHVGFAVARGDRGAVAMLAIERALARLHVVRPKPTGEGFVLVRGRMLEPVSYVTGYLNQGATGVVECERATNLALPEFAVRCVMAEGDDYASLDIASYEPGRVLGRPVASLLARREDATIGEYRLEPVGAPAVPSTPEVFARAVVARVNGIRAAAGLARLRLEAGQSAKMIHAVPHFFAPGATGELEDLVALTMIAGWDVEGLIQDASFAATQVRERDVSRWVAFALERPFMRHTLLSPEADALAVSALVEPGGTSALFAHYQLFDESRPRFDEVAVAVLDRITAVRVGRGLPAPTEVRDKSALQAEVDRVRTDGKDVRDVMDAALSRSAREWERSVGGFWVSVGGNPRAMTVPNELLQPGELYLQAVATFHRAPGAPWGQYLVFVITAR